MTSSLQDELYKGCILITKRWSGDCGEMSLVDEVATDTLMAKAAAEIDRLLQTESTMIISPADMAELDEIQAAADGVDESLSVALKHHTDHMAKLSKQTKDWWRLRRDEHGLDPTAKYRAVRKNGAAVIVKT